MTTRQPRLSLLLAAGADVTRARATVDATLTACAAALDWELVVAVDATRPQPPVGGADGRHVRVVAAKGAPAEQLSAALAAAHGRWVAVVGLDDHVEPGALEAVAATLDSRPDADVVYTDEQWPGVGAEGIFTKPGWVPEYERGTDYLGRLCFVRRSLVDAVGGFQPGAAYEWDLHLRCVERTDRIVHVPVVGVTRLAAPAADDETWDAGLEAVRSHVARSGQHADVRRSAVPGGAVVWRAVPEPPLVSVVVPTGGGRRDVRGTPTLLAEMCARSLVERTAYPRWELVLVCSEGTPADVVERVRTVVGDRLVVEHVEGPFNFSRSVNRGVAAASGELVLLLNDDVEGIEPDWLDRMVSVIQDPSIGAVGARLVHEGGLLQHVGVVYSDVWVPWHAFQQQPDGFHHFGVGMLDTDFTAATGACLLLSRDLFVRLGGASEALPLNYNDVDLCHKVVRDGLRVVVTPVAHLHHYESSTREAVIRPEEIASLQGHWQWLAWSDPWTNLRSVV